MLLGCDEDAGKASRTHECVCVCSSQPRGVTEGVSLAQKDGVGSWTQWWSRTHRFKSNQDDSAWTQRAGHHKKAFLSLYRILAKFQWEGRRERFWRGNCVDDIIIQRCICQKGLTGDWQSGEGMWICFASLIPPTYHFHFHSNFSITS